MQEIVQLSVAPVFLLAAIGALLNVMTTRLFWINARVERIEELRETGKTSRFAEELPDLKRRRTYAQGAVTLSTAAALTICLVVVLLFVSAFIRPQIGTIVAGAWILTMVFLFVGLALFVLETRLGTSAVAERRRRSRQIVQRQASIREKT